MDSIETALSELRASVRPLDADTLALRTGWRPGRVTRPRPRTGRLVMTATAVLAAGATAAALVLTAGRTGDGVHMGDGKTFMLAAATKLEHAPETGNCWYMRSYDIFGSSKGPVRLGVATPGPGADQMLESWTCQGAGVRTKITYPAGKGKTTTNDYSEKFTLPYKIQVADIRTVSDPARLEQLVKSAYAKEDKSKWWPSAPSFEQYLWSVSRALITSDVPPKTKAALYRLLAAQKGITNLGERKDKIGRTGVAISLRLSNKSRSDGDGPATLLFNPTTGELMAELTGQQTVIEKMGWAAHKDDRP